MIVNKVPEFEPITCECGCEFEWELGDESYCISPDEGGEIWTHCPVCGRTHQLIYKKKDPSKTEIELGRGWTSYLFSAESNE
jgi:hypothetical protein